MTVSGDGPRCSFELAGSRAGIEDGGWRCPHDSHGDTDRCVFHLADDERAAAGVDDDELHRRFFDALERPGRRTKQFLGATFDRLDLSYRDVDGPDNYPIDLRHATVRDGIRAVDAAVGHPITLDNARLGGLVVTNVDFRRGFSMRAARVTAAVELQTAFEGRVDFSGTEFEGPLEFDQMAFDRYARFDDCVFREEADFYVDFNEEPHFTGARFDARADFFMDVNADSYFDDVTFRGPTSVYAEFNGDAYFDGTTFGDDVRVYGHFNVDAHFHDATFGGLADFRWDDTDVDAVRFSGVTDFSDATFSDDADFGNVEFIGGADFSNARFAGAVSFHAATFARPAGFVDVRFEDRLSLTATEFDRRLTLSTAVTDGVVDLSSADLSAGTIRVAPSTAVRYDLTRATVGDVRLCWAGTPPSDETLLSRFTVAETEFEGFDFSHHRGELARQNWRLYDGRGGDSPEAEETTYLKAKNGATDVGENRAASEFFLRELRARRRRHRSDAFDGSGVAARVRGAARYAANLSMDVSCGFGEKPSRVVLSSLFVITSFAAGYRLLDVTVQYDGSVGYLVFSLETFVALVLGSPRVSEPYVNLLTATEAFLGAYFIALFVFTLTRSIHR